MKKIIALLLVFASLFLFAACKDESVETDPIKNANEFSANQAEIEAEFSRQAAEKAAEESEIQEEINEYIKEVGKTKKKTQLVVEIENWDLGKKYYKFEFSKKGEFKSRTTYVFYDSLENYFAELEIKKNAKDYKLIDNDKDMKMIVVKDTDFNGDTFDVMYKLYGGKEVEHIYNIVE